MLGTETVARLLGLRLNHPAGSEHLERAPKVPASRAEAAYSLAKLLTLEAWRGESIRSSRQGSSCPRSPTGNARSSRRHFASSAIRTSSRGRRRRRRSSGAHGAGRHDHRARRLRLLGPRLAGLQARAVRGAPPLFAGVLKGRTTYAMSGEVARPLRIDPAALAPGDVVFFGSKGAEVEADGGRTRGDLRRQRLVRPLVERGRHAAAAAGLVRDDSSPGRVARSLRPGSCLIRVAGRADGVGSRRAWKRVPGHGDVEDRRGQGGGLGGGGSPDPDGQGRRRSRLIIVLVVLALLFGGQRHRRRWQWGQRLSRPVASSRRRPRATRRSAREPRGRRLRVHEVRRQGRAGHVGEAVRRVRPPVPACAGRHLHRRQPRPAAARPRRDGPVLLPGRQQGVPRPLVLPGARHGASARRATSRPRT